MEDEKPKLALIGYGAMGKEIEIIAREQHLYITDIFELNSILSSENQYDFDVAIDFSYPEYLYQNLSILAHLKKNVVIGTTGWYDKMDDIKSIVDKSGIGCIYGSNFSLGMQMFFKIIEQASHLMNKVTNYDIFVNEIHHKKKKDSPSGTALSIADIILKNVKNKNEMFDNKIEGAVNPRTLHVSSTRGGEITGTHTVYIDSFADTIEITHRAKNRSGFAVGAIAAAKWIHGRTGFYQLNEMLNSLWKD